MCNGRVIQFGNKALELLNMSYQLGLRACFFSHRNGAIPSGATWQRQAPNGIQLGKTFPSASQNINKRMQFVVLQDVNIFEGSDEAIQITTQLDRN